MKGAAWNTCCENRKVNVESLWWMRVLHHQLLPPQPLLRDVFQIIRTEPGARQAYAQQRVDAGSGGRGKSSASKPAVPSASTSSPSIRRATRQPGLQAPASSSGISSRRHPPTGSKRGGAGGLSPAPRRGGSAASTSHKVSPASSRRMASTAPVVLPSTGEPGSAVEEGMRKLELECEVESETSDVENGCFLHVPGSLSPLSPSPLYGVCSRHEIKHQHVCLLCASTLLLGVPL